jgi:hypothetical protein
MTLKKRAVWGFVLAIALLPGKGVWAQSHARLPESLRKHMASKSTAGIEQNVGLSHRRTVATYGQRSIL